MRFNALAALPEAPGGNNRLGGRVRDVLKEMGRKGDAVTKIYKVKRFTIPEENRKVGMRPLVDTLSKILFTDYYEEIEPDRDDQADPEKGDHGRREDRGALDNQNTEHKHNTGG